ncbi:hemolysin family protein [Sphingomonas mucosissima]|uniref:Hemolysin C n=1 Tax=Sphingomonas mucosissima TaxID=370959 RepID=A0A245ZJT9_9SPHN|nr:hemolysin family protein [Sphingomonas mucosissima]OWK30003.1 hemolysin C [Sphingomonas mucosissima]
MSEYLIPIAAILVLVLVNGVFVAAEFALVGARRSRLETFAQGGSGAARWLVGVFDREAGKDAYIAVAQLGITLASIGLGMYGEPAVAAWLYPTLEGWGLIEDQSHGVAFVIALGGITYLHVVLGEMIPKALALQVPESVIISVNPAMRAFGFVFRPMVYVLNQIAFALMRILGIKDPGRSSTLYTAQELAIATEEVAASGQFDRAQRMLIGNIFEMEDRTAEELMTSRARIVAVELGSDAATIAAKIGANTQTRYPVYGGSLDDVIGVLHVKDFIRAHLRGGDFDVRVIARPLARVAATTSATMLMALFKKQRVHAALVVDEFGGTLGMVTMDDLVEDLIDEDENPASDWIRKLSDGSFQLDGEVTLAELREDFAIDLEQPGVVTVAGLFLAANGMIPDKGATLERKGYRLVVEEMSRRKINRVSLHKIQ